MFIFKQPTTPGPTGSPTYTPTTASPLPEGVERTARPTFIPTHMPTDQPSSSPTSIPTISADTIYSDKMKEILSIYGNADPPSIVQRVTYGEMEIHKEIRLGGCEEWSSALWGEIPRSSTVLEATSIQVSRDTYYRR